MTNNVLESFEQIAQNIFMIVNLSLNSLQFITNGYRKYLKITWTKLKVRFSKSNYLEIEILNSNIQTWMTFLFYCFAIMQFDCLKCCRCFAFFLTRIRIDRLAIVYIFQFNCSVCSMHKVSLMVKLNETCWNSSISFVLSPMHSALYPKNWVFLHFPLI